MAIRLQNDLTRRKDDFAPQTPERVTFYTCGPTVYNYFHIGNARAFVVFDALRQYLKYRGLPVVYVQNFTDVDDKIINRARELGRDAGELAAEMVEAYFADADALGVQRADVHPRVTDHIPDIIAHVQALVERGYAYEIDGDGVYYRVTRNPKYGRLSGHNLNDLVAGSRVEVDDRKEHPMDFVLWKAQKPGEPGWDSPWGPGRPGWHIECSVMARHYLGDTLDIHAGGEDLVFPHHENEIAQSEPVTGATFARFWLHNAFLNMEGEKMSKSVGNIRWTRDLLRDWDGEIIRFYLLSAHYRTPLDFSLELLGQARSALDRLYNAVHHLQHLEKTAAVVDLQPGEEQVLAEFEGQRRRFVEGMDDDFNTAIGQSVLFDLARDAFARVTGDSSQALARAARGLLEELAGVMGLLRNAGQAGGDLDAEIQALVDERQAARKARNWAESDRIRDDLKGLGIILEDTPQGVRWKRA